MDFVHLHAHTHYSMQSSPVFPGQLFEAAAKLGMQSIAVTDYGAIFNMPELFSEAEKSGIRLIIGSEILLRETSHHQDGRNTPASSLILLVQNDTGYRNLCILLSRAARDGFVDGMPHLERSLFREFHGGLVCLSGYSSGRIGRSLLAGAVDDAREHAVFYRDIFGDRFYLELQRHNSHFDDELNSSTIALAEECCVGVVATNNIHYLERKDSDCYRAMAALKAKQKLSSQNLSALPGSEHFLKSPAEMRELFGDGHGELSNTVLIAESCSFVFREKEPILPHFPLPEGFADEAAYLRHLTAEGAKEKYPGISEDEPSQEEVRDRIELELGVIEKMGFSSYFLIVSDLIAASRRLGYSVGPGRGSAAGSIVAYLTGITRIDPLRYKLLFERFLNPERLSMPDIDIDFTPVGKQKVLDYTVERYGAESVAKVVAIGTLGAKAAIRDAARVLDVPLSVADQLAKLVPQRPGITLETALSEVRELKEQAEATPQNRELMTYASALEGRARNVSVHAGAVVITGGPLEEQVPLYVSNRIETEARVSLDAIAPEAPQPRKHGDPSAGKQVITQFDKNWIETAGLLKIDYLGLETLAVIDETLQLIRRRHNVEIDLEKVPMTDRKTFRIFQEGKMAGIFQFESSGMQSYMTRLQPTQIGDIIAMSALYRPGALNARIDEKRNAVDLFVDRKHGREVIDYMHPMLETILKETYGVIVYQEQVMQISQVMGGFSLAKADNLRKAMGKKKPEIMERFKVDFVQGAVAQGVHDTLATRVFELMAEFAGYGFNKSHSAAYGVLAYWTGYLKAHYTIEFMTAILNSEIGDTERMKHLTDEARSFGIATLPPSINRSDAIFSVEESPDGAAIRVGLSAIKQVGGAAKAIIAARLRRKREFLNLFELTASVDQRVMNRKALECLILAGAFDEIDSHRARLIANIDKAIKFGQIENRSAALGQCGFFTAEEGAVQEDGHYPDMENALQMPEQEKLQHEKRLVGFYLSRHPLSPWRRDWQAFASLHLNERDVVAQRQYRIIGLVVSTKPYQDRKGKQMLFGSIEDFTGKADFTVFASVFEQSGHLLKPEAVVMLVAEAESTGGTLKLLVREVLPVSSVRKSMTKKIILKVDADEGGQLERLDRLKAVFDEHRGDTPVDFEVKVQSGESVETLKLFARSSPVDCDEEVLSKVEEILGPDNVIIAG